MSLFERVFGSLLGDAAGCLGLFIGGGEGSIGICVGLKVGYSFSPAHVFLGQENEKYKGKYRSFEVTGRGSEVMLTIVPLHGSKINWRRPGAGCVNIGMKTE